MAGLKDFRAQHPEYDDMSDDELAGALHRKFYSDVPYEEFARRIGQSDQLSGVVSGMTPSQIELARVTDNTELGDYLRSLAKQPKPNETKEQTQERLYGKAMRGPSKPLSATVGAADTLSYGYGDEMAAGIEAMTGARSYSDALENQRRMAEAAKNENPNSYFGGQVAGAVAPALLTFGSSASASGGSIGRQMLRSGVTAAGQGGLYGYGSGTGGVANRAQEAGKNALFSGALGLASPLVAAGVGAGWRGFLNYWSGRGLDVKAGEQVADMLSKSGITPQQAAQKLDDLGPEGMIADLTQIEAAGTARASSEAGELMARRTSNRMAGAGGRMASDLDNAFGPVVDPFSVKEASRLAKGAVGPEYEAAIANAPQLPKDLGTLLGYSLTDPASGMSMSARKTMGAIMSEIEDALIADTPQQTAARLLNIRQQLDAQIVYDSRSFATLSSADKAAQATLKQARGVVDDILKNRIPGIADADAKFAPISKQQAAYDYGQKNLLRGGSGAVTPAELSSKLKAATPAERKMMAQGARAEIDRVLSNSRNNPATQTDRITSRDWNGDKVELLVGPQRSSGLLKAIERENTFTETSNLIEPSRGSRTAVLSAAQSRWGGGGGGGVGSDMAAAYAGGFSGSGSNSVGLLSAGAVGARRLAKTLFGGGKANEKLIVQTADKLTKSGTDAKRVVRGLLDIAASKQSNEAKGRAAAKLVNGLLSNSARLDDVNEPLVGGPYRSARGLLQ